MTRRTITARIVAIAALAVVAAASLAAAEGQRFPDVPADHEAHAAIEWAAEVGITAGYDDGTFKPQRPLNRRHAVVFLERYYDEILRADQSEDFTRGDMMMLLKTINDANTTEEAEQPALGQPEYECPPGRTFNQMRWKTYHLIYPGEEFKIEFPTEEIWIINFCDMPGP